VNSLQQALLLGVGLPALAALILAGLVAGTTRLRNRLSESSLAFALALSFGLAIWLTLGGIVFPPREASHWLVYLCLAEGLLALLLAAPQPVISLLVWVGGSVLAAWTSLQYLTTENSPNVVWAIVGGAVVAITGGLFQSLVVPRRTVSETLLGFAVTAGIGAVTIFFAHSATLGQLCGTFGLIFAAAFLVLLAFNRQLGQPVSFLYWTLLAALLLNATLFAGLSWIPAILLWVAPFALAAVPRFQTSGLGRRIGSLVLSGLAAAVIAAIAFIIVYVAAGPNSEM
jgi:hypothetical protein